jgi:F-box and WD-40 domain protein CDC4
MEPSRLQRQSHTVSVDFDESTNMDGVTTTTESRLQLSSECIETRTVTTTTTTKRVYPPILVRAPRSMDMLGKEYPLSSAPMPSELLSFSFAVPTGEEWENFREDAAQRIVSAGSGDVKGGLEDARGLPDGARGLHANPARRHPSTPS